MPPKRQNQSITIKEGLTIIILVLGIIWAIYDNYPTIYSIAQGTTEVLPLELNNGAQSYIQLKNSGGISVIITVNFSSDGSIRFKNDKEQIKDSLEVSYSVEPDKTVNFRFIPIINNTFKNATLHINYNSYMEIFKLKPKNSEYSWTGLYEKNEAYFPVGTLWELR